MTDRVPAFLLMTIPSSDTLFREQVERMQRRHPGDTPVELEGHLRRLFPRVTVRQRVLSGERPSWYVYRDGGWSSPLNGSWWEGDGLGRLTISPEGWIGGLNATAAGLLAIDPAHASTWHISDLVPPGAQADAIELLRNFRIGQPFSMTVVVRPTSGDLLALDIHASQDGAGTIVLMRLAVDVVPPPSAGAAVIPELTSLPAGDAAFRAYTDRALARMPEPTPERLLLRVHRLYPHARIEVRDDRWIISRDSGDGDSAPARWWTEPHLPRVDYDPEGLIADANEAARVLLGRDLVGHYWQEFVTPGSTEQVTAMLAILADVGAAESRFRMPDAAGALIEFDSYTSVVGDAFTTIMRARSIVSAAAPAVAETAPGPAAESS